MEQALKLDDFSHILQKAIDRIRNILTQDRPDKYIAQGLENLNYIRQLTTDIQKLANLQIKQIEYFLKDKVYNSKVFQVQLKLNGINKKWFSILIQKIQDILLRIKQLSTNQTTRIYTELYNIRVYRKLLTYAVIFSEKDLFNFDTVHKVWQQFATYKTLAATEEIATQLITVEKILTVGAATIQQVQESKNFIKRSFLQGFGIFKNFLNAENRNSKSIQFKLSLQPRKFKSLMNSMQQGIKGKIMSLANQSIEYVKLIYIPELFKKITSNAILKWLKQQSKSTIDLEKLEQSNQKTKSNIFNQNQNNIRIRVLSNEKFQRQKKQINSQEDSQFVILHIHGGGFIGLSSNSHQIYTRKWAKECNVPIFGVDYKKTPEFPFPSAVNDVWQAYNWIIHQSHKYFKLKEKKKIIVQGDSAGGNLVLVLTNLCILQNIQLPYQIIPFYPVIRCNYKNFTPSYLHTFYDPVLSYQAMDLFIDIYVTQQEFNSEQNFLLSPLFTPNYILQKYPPISIFGGQKDVLFDDTVRFCVRLRQNKIAVKFTVYKDMIHGFLTLSKLLSCSKECLEDSIQKIKSILNDK